MPSSITTRALVSMLGACALVLAACDGGGSETTDDGAPPPPVTEADDPDDGVDDDDLDEPADPDDQAAGDEGEETDDPDPSDDDLEPLRGEASTGPVEAEGDAGTLAVTDVRVATHEGFDRIVFETQGDGVPGWFVYYDEATSQGSGEPVEVDGEVTLRVAVNMVTLPPDLPDDLQPWDGERLDGPPGGVVDEVVADTIFEGIHLFFVGLDEERPFIVERFDDPHRVVIDIPHDG